MMPALRKSDDPPQQPHEGDMTAKLKVLDLFSGIGGFSLGLERTGGFETTQFCEYEPFCQRVLKYHWPHVPLYDDIRIERFHGQKFDVICGGFPCQPFSTASRGRKTAADLWPYMAKIIAHHKPKVFIAENVQERPIRNAEKFARKLGYRTTVKRIGAHEAGADHQRNRWWLCAHPYDESEFLRALNAKVAMLPEICSGLWGPDNYARAIRVPHGVPNRMDRSYRLQALGNPVCPFIPEIIGQTILQMEA